MFWVYAFFSSFLTFFSAPGVKLLSGLRLGLEDEHMIRDHVVHEFPGFQWNLYVSHTENALLTHLLKRSSLPNAVADRSAYKLGLCLCIKRKAASRPKKDTPRSAIAIRPKSRHKKTCGSDLTEGSLVKIRFLSPKFQIVGLRQHNSVDCYVFRLTGAFANDRVQRSRSTSSIESCDSKTTVELTRYNRFVQ